MEKGSLEKEVEAAIESFINREGIDSRLNEPDFEIAKRFMDFIPANPNSRSIRQVVDAIEEVVMKSAMVHRWQTEYKPDEKEAMDEET